ncbi:MAG: helix-turn-helix domain-containing protein [Candidatus Micrarchaeota archaeon]|nr:helix-turn-helix domain-containing protein [Candidatus Micrarchaeota archaeon]
MSEKNQPLIVEMEQVHNCISVEVCEKLKDLKLKWLATINSDEKAVTNLFELDSEKLKKAVQKIREHTNVKDVKIIINGPKKSQITITTIRSVATAPYLAKTGTMWIEPTWTEGGVDYVTMLAPNYKSLKQFMDLVSEKGYDLKIKSKRYLDPKETLSLDTFRTSGFTKLRTAGELLTDRQMEVFDLACRYGYYEEPKKISIEELGIKLDISPSTCAELLRKAERKLLPILSDVLRIMR